MAGQRFVTTRWSLIAAAGQSLGEARAALDQLCRIYWLPLYMFVRRERAHRTAADAADLTQEFFADLLERRDIAHLDRGRGTFRSWLLQAMRHFLANQHDRDTALKRGGGERPLSLDTVQAEHLYSREPSDGLDAERLYTRRWAMIAVERAVAALRAELADGDPERARKLDAVMGTLLGEPPDGGYDALAASLGTTAGALRKAAHDWRKLLRREVADTMALGADIDAEIEELFGALS